MKKLQRTMSLALVSAMTMSLVACGSSTTTSTAENTSAAASKAATTEAGTAATSVAAAAAATSTAAASGDKVTITFAYDEGVGDGARDLMDAYNASQDKYTVQGYSMPQDSNNLHDDFVNKLSSEDTSVDVMALDVVYISEFASAGWIDKLDDTDFAKDTSSFLDGTIDGATVDGHLYAIPWTTNSSMLFYRTDALKAAGITEVPTTWQGWEDAYKKLPSDSGIDYAFSFQGKQSESMVCDWVEFIWGFGGDVLDDSGKPVINSQENIDATNMMAGLIGTYAPEGTTTYAETESQQVFEEGKALTCRTWSGTWNNFNDASESKVAGNVGVTVLPVNKEGDTAHSCLGGLDLALNTYVDDAHKAAALDFMQWMTSQDSQVKMTLSTSQPPTRKAVYQDASVLKAVPFYSDFYNVISNGKGRPKTANYAELSDAIQRHVHSVLTGDAKAEDALKDLQTEAEGLMQ